MLPLRDVIRALRAEIIAAVEAGVGEAVKFEVGPIEVEFTVIAKRDGGPEGKIKFEVFGLGAEAGGEYKFASEQAQKVKFQPTAVRPLPTGGRERLEINRIPGAS
jgi:hypothetical protein